MVDIKLAQPFRSEVRIVGHEETPVIIVDDLLETVDSLRHFAIEHAQFEYDERFAYPGIRAQLPPGYAAMLVPRLCQLIAEVYSPPKSFELQLIHQFFSLITRRPEELVPLQRAPHFDTNEPHYFATVHYLNPGPAAGTGLFRHRPTGFERISKVRLAKFAEAAQAHVTEFGWPEQKYINASDGHFEMIGEIEYRPNRLIMYPGNLLHSGLIDPSRDVSSDPATGRLTANLFLYFR